MNQHCMIVGGGVIGLSVAWELARRGVGVTLLERDQVGRATSWSGAGILPPANFELATDPLDQLRGLSHQMFPAWVEELESITKIDCGFRTCGGWYLTETNGEQAAMIGMAGYWQALGIHCESVSNDLLAQREPALCHWASQPHTSAWWTPDECQIRPPRYLQALAQACRMAGVEIIENANVIDVRQQTGHCEAMVNGRWRQADSMVLCGGVWSGRVARSLRLSTSLVPVRGQLLLLKTESPLLQGIANVGQRYVICRDDGYTLVGSNEEETGFELGVTAPVLEALYEFAIRLVPALASSQCVDSWSGLRPLTFDGFPMIGRIPETDNLYLAAGHFRSGLHLSPATAETLVDEMMGKPPQVCLKPFRVGKQQSQGPATSNAPEMQATDD